MGMKEMEELNYVLEKNFVRRSNDRKISEGNCVWQTSNGSSGSLFTKRQNVFSIRFRIYLTEIHEIFFERNHWIILLLEGIEECSNSEWEAEEHFEFEQLQKIGCIFLIIMY